MAARLKAVVVAGGKGSRGEETWMEIQLLVTRKAHKGDAGSTV